MRGPPGAGKTLFVVERQGKIKVLKDGRRESTFLDIRNRVRCCDGERGLFSIAFKNFKRSRLVYVYYTDRKGDLRIVEFKRRARNRLKANAGSARTVLRIRHRQESNHNGGQLQFGPDGLLYIATGDGGGSGDPFENSQDRSSLLGKLLRIDPRKKGKRRYRVPRGNPYVGRPGKNEIFARGLRNPFRFSFDRRRIAIGDVGQDRFEEVNFERLSKARGANFGWDRYEGNAIFEGPAFNQDQPIHTYGHSGGRCSITGGYVVRDRSLRSLYGRYLYADLCTGQIRSLIASPAGARDDGRTGLTNQPGIVSFGVDDRNRVYVASGAGVKRIVQR